MFRVAAKYSLLLLLFCFVNIYFVVWQKHIVEFFDSLDMDRHGLLSIDQLVGPIMFYSQGLGSEDPEG